MQQHISFMRSSNGNRDVACYLYVPDGKIRAIVQLCHGMCEYTENYSLFCERLCSAGIAVCGNDHLGHGNTAEDARDLGYFGGGGYHTLVKDLRRLNKRMRTVYRGVPVVLFGHGMGELLARDYVIRYPETVDGVILSGIVSLDSPVSMAKTLAAAVGKSRGNHFRSKMLYNLTFKGLNTNFSGEGEFAWLSRDLSAALKFKTDPQRNFIFTANGCYSLFSLLGAVSKSSALDEYPEAMPTLIISGTGDPVGNFGKAPAALAEKLSSGGAKNTDLKLYDGARHELYNETNKEEFFGDVIKWIEKNIHTL